jgi:hypothetical protein
MAFRHRGRDVSYAWKRVRLSHSQPKMLSLYKKAMLLHSTTISARVSAYRLPTLFTACLTSAGRAFSPGWFRKHN